MSDANTPKPTFAKANEALTAAVHDLVALNPSYHLGVTCRKCHGIFYFDNNEIVPVVTEIVTVRPQGNVPGYRFTFRCPDCNVPLRFDGRSIRIRVEAVHDVPDEADA